MSELKKVWRGEVGLVVTYWVWGVLVANILLGNVLGFVVGAIQNEFLSLLHPVLVVAVNVFATVAIWRSAASFKGQMIWVFLARLTSVANVIVLALAVLGAFDASE